jgi:hypothetical protein
MENLLGKYIIPHFNQLTDRLDCFYKQGVQVEGWFKGELLFLLTKLKEERIILDFDRETVIINRKKIDIAININNLPHYIELKHWLCGCQRSNFLFGPSFYFPDHTSVGIIKDVNKLINIPISGQKWLLILMTKNPGDESWQNGLRAFHSKYPSYNLSSCSVPNSFCDSYFLGLLNVSEIANDSDATF